MRCSIGLCASRFQWTKHSRFFSLFPRLFHSRNSARNIKPPKIDEKGHLEQRWRDSNYVLTHTTSKTSKGIERYQMVILDERCPFFNCFWTPYLWYLRRCKSPFPSSFHHNWCVRREKTDKFIKDAYKYRESTKPGATYFTRMFKRCSFGLTRTPFYSLF